MKSKILSILAGVILAYLPVIVSAQEISEEVILEQIELARLIGQTQIIEVVNSSMQLSEEEAEGFWPVYENYMAEILDINDRLLELITEYADYYNNEGITEGEASRIINEYFDIESDRLDVKKFYIRNFKEVLPEQKVLLFFQIDNRLQNLINQGLFSEIPLIIE